MSQLLLQDIFKQVTKLANRGIAVQDNNTQSWIMPFTTFAQMNANGFNTVESCLENVRAQGYEDITVYLKRKNGSSSEYVKNKLVRLVAPNETDRDVSTNQAAFSGNSENAPALAKTPTQHAPIMSKNQPMGMLGGMNMQVMDMYSKSSQYASQNEELQAVKAELATVKADNERLKFDNFKLDSKLENKNSEKKTIVSDEMASMFLSIAPTLAEKFAKSSVGLNAPAQLPAENFSVQKTQLLNFIKNDGITDDYCQLLTAVLNNAVADENVVKQLQELAQPKTN
jgi:transcriptional regulator NrdR family protein